MLEGKQVICASHLQGLEYNFIFLWLLCSPNTVQKKKKNMQVTGCLPFSVSECSEHELLSHLSRILPHAPRASRVVCGAAETQTQGLILLNE